MKIPICIISFNRSYYLDSLLASLSEEADNHEIIVVDNGSTEFNMSKVIKKWENIAHFMKLPGGDWINDEYKAKNSFLQHVSKKIKKPEHVLFLQDDLQYVGPVGCLHEMLENVKHENLLLTAVTGVRRSTVFSTYSNRKIGNSWLISDQHFGTMGLYRYDTFEKVGKYSQNYPLEKSFWGRGEDDYHARVISKYSSDRSTCVSAHAHVPFFVGVWNDPRGGYSFIRNGKRYGHYLPALSDRYYRNLSKEEYESLEKRLSPSSYTDIAFPIGWSYASKDGDQLKYPQAKVMEEGPVSDI